MRSTLLVSVAGLAALSSAMPTTAAPPHHTTNYGPTSSLHAHSTSAAYSQPTHGPKPGDLVLSFWSYLASHISRPSHISHPYGTHTTPGPKPKPTCIYNDHDFCEPIPRPHHVVPTYTSSSVSRSGHGSHGSASHSYYVPKTASLGPYPTSEVTHKPHPPKKTPSPTPHPSYARRDLLNDEEKPPCRPGSPWCGFHSHPAHVPTGHSKSSYAPKNTPEYPSSVVESSTYSSKSHHPPRLTFSHAPWPSYSSKGHSTSSYAPKHTSKPAHSHPQGPPKYPSSTVSHHHSPPKWTIPGLPPKWPTIYKPTSARPWTPKYTSSLAPYSRNTPKYSTSKPAHSYRHSPPKHTESPSYPQFTPQYTSSAATYPHSTPKYTTSSAHHPHHNTYPSPPKSTSVNLC